VRPRGSLAQGRSNPAHEWVLRKLGEELHYESLLFPDCRCRLHQLLVYLLKLFAFLAPGCSAQTWDVNALSRCNSKFRITSSKDLPAGALEGLKNQAHSEQPGGRQNLGSGYFVPFSCPLLFEYAESFSALKWPSAGICATFCFDTPQSKSSAQKVWFHRVPLGASTHKRQTSRLPD
jgi:hypothetical protein